MKISRRKFLKVSAAIAPVLALPAFFSPAPKRVEVPWQTFVSVDPARGPDMAAIVIYGIDSDGFKVKEVLHFDGTNDVTTSTKAWKYVSRIGAVT